MHSTVHISDAFTALQLPSASDIKKDIAESVGRDELGEKVERGENGGGRV